MHLPDREIPYEELFYRKSDVIVLHARTAELVDRGYGPYIALAAAVWIFGGKELVPWLFAM